MFNKYLLVLISAFTLTSAALAGDQKLGEQTSDAWLKTKIVTIYAVNEHLNPFTIGVEVTNGKATLTGTVENDIERDLAEELAKGVDGVKEVDNEITIDPEVQRNPKGNSFYRKMEDANITARVKLRFLMEKNIHGLKIHVETKNGVVSLDGNVNSEIEADLARQIALNTEGVTDVKNNLEVSPESEQPVNE